MKKQAGFTLIELMISIGLGLIIVASALMLFLSGQRNVAVQKSATDLQEDQNFGLSYIAKNIRNANLNSPTASLNASASLSGIVFSIAEAEKPATGTTAKVAAKAGNLPDNLGLGANFANTYLTITSTEDANKSNMKLKSAVSATVNDQLTIQYRPVEIGGYDCEGNEITQTDIYILERYFVRTDDNGGGNADQRAALACASSYYLAGGTELKKKSTNGIYGSGQIIMKRVDLFKVRFLVQTTSGQKRYMTINEYRGDSSGRILAVQLGIIARAPDGSSERSISTTQEFSLLGQVFTQKDTFPNRYLRTPIMQTVALRNALGDRS